MFSRPDVRATREGWSRTVVRLKSANKNFCKALRAISTELVGRDCALVEIYDTMLCGDGSMGEILCKQEN